MLESIGRCGCCLGFTLYCIEIDSLHYLSSREIRSYKDIEKKEEGFC